MVKQEHFSHSGKPSLFALAPFAVFVSTYILLITVYPYVGNHVKLTAFPVFSCFVAITFALFTFQEKVSFKKKIKIFISGASRPTVIYMCFIFIFSSIFSHIVSLNGSVDAAIKLCHVLIPPGWILPGLFTAIALFALTIGSSIGGVATFMPIAVGISQKFNIDPALMAGIVVSGSMLGDNLSIVSDTTIAAIHVTNCNPAKKFKENAMLVLPAFLITVLVLVFLNTYFHQPFIQTGLITSWSASDIFKLIPYASVFLLALTGLDVLVVLAAGSLIAIALGLLYGKFSILLAITFFFDGFYEQKSIVSMLVLVMLIAGLSRIIEHNGGIKYLMNKFHARTKTPTGAEGSIALLVSLLDIAVARNTIAIMIAGPIAQQIGGRFKIPSARIACLLDIFACGIHGIIPYSSQLLLAAAMAEVSSVSIIPHLHYQFVILIVAILSIAKTRWKRT